MDVMLFFGNKKKIKKNQNQILIQYR